jgi:uncharacterized protein
VTEDPRRTRRRLYRIGDNFLAFWLEIVDRHRAAIERGLGKPVLVAMLAALAGRGRVPVLAGEAKWARRVDGRRLASQLEQKSRALPGVDQPLKLAVCAREQVDDPAGTLAVTAADIFS